MPSYHTLPSLYLHFPALPCTLLPTSCMPFSTPSRPACFFSAREDVFPFSSACSLLRSFFARLSLLGASLPCHAWPAEEGEDWRLWGSSERRFERLSSKRGRRRDGRRYRDSHLLCLAFAIRRTLLKRTFSVLPGAAAVLPGRWTSRNLHTFFFFFFF